MIDRATIDRILDTARIEEVVSDFVALKRRGTNYVACCPFHHEKTPSFSVSPAKGIYKCFGCGKAGSVVTFVMEHEQMSYVEALKYLGRKYGIEVKEKEETAQDVEQRLYHESLLIVNDFARQFYIRTLWEHPEGQAVGLSYFRERGFTDQTIRKFQLGYAPNERRAFTHQAQKAGYKKEHLVAVGLTIERESSGELFDRFYERVMFPIRSISGKVIAFGGRKLRNDNKEIAKYINSPESEVYIKNRSLYGIFEAKAAIVREQKCYLVEGYTDVISFHQAGVENVVASSGTSLTTGQIGLIKRFTNKVTVLYDGDFAGIKASLRGIDMLLEEGLEVKVALFPDGEDPDSYARSHTREEIRTFLSEQEEDFITFKYKILSKDIQRDPIQRARLITEIIGSIAVIPDAIVRSVYIEETSSRLHIGEDLLQQEVAKIRRKKQSDAYYNRLREEKQAAARSSYTHTGYGTREPHRPTDSSFPPYESRPAGSETANRYGHDFFPTDSQGNDLPGNGHSGNGTIGNSFARENPASDDPAQNGSPQGSAASDGSAQGNSAQRGSDRKSYSGESYLQEKFSQGVSYPKGPARQEPVQEAFAQEQGVSAQGEEEGPAQKNTARDGSAGNDDPEDSHRGNNYPGNEGSPDDFPGNGFAVTNSTKKDLAENNPAGEVPPENNPEKRGSAGNGLFRNISNGSGSGARREGNSYSGNSLSENGDSEKGFSGTGSPGTGNSGTGSFRTGNSGRSATGAEGYPGNYGGANFQMPSFVVNTYCEEAEKEILYYLIKFGHLPIHLEEQFIYGAQPEKEQTVAQYILEQLQNDDLELQNLVYKNIFDEYFRLEETEEEKILRYFINHPDSSVSQVVLDLTIQPYTITIKRFTKSLIPEKNVLGKAVPKSILIYKAKVTAQAAMNLTEELGRAQKDNDQEKLKRLMEQLNTLMQVRNVFSKELNRITF